MHTLRLFLRRLTTFLVTNIECLKIPKNFAYKFNLEEIKEILEENKLKNLSWKLGAMN